MREREPGPQPSGLGNDNEGPAAGPSFVSMLWMQRAYGQVAKARVSVFAGAGRPRGFS